MDIREHQKSIYLTRQRNFFAGLSGLAVIANFLLVGKLAVIEEKIIMIPGIAREMIIEGAQVSQSYLEESALLFASCLLDLTADTVPAKRDMILKYTSNSDSSFSKKINEYFADSLEKYKNFDLVTYFTVKNMEIDEGSGEVIAHGILTSRYGKHGFESNPTSYRLSFEFSGGYLRLKEFNQVVSDKEKKEGKQEPKGALVK